MAAWLKELLFDWVFVLAYGILKAFLKILDVIESFFDIFAGTAKVYYQGTADFLINIFFADSSVTNAFWAMGLIAIALAFGFCIINLMRKTVDVTGAVKQSVGQIMSNFFRCLLIIISLNAAVTITITASNVLLDRINYALTNAAILNLESETKYFSDEEYAAMASILSTVGNYSVNDTETSRYNVNSCFNDIRAELLYLTYNNFFEYDYEVDEVEDITETYDLSTSEGFSAWVASLVSTSTTTTTASAGTPLHSWQSALALLASSANLTEDLALDVYNESVTNAFSEVVYNMRYNADFGPVESAEAKLQSTSSLSTATTVFLIASLEAAQNSSYNTNPSFDDSLRLSYVNDVKDWADIDQVRKYFDIWEIDYLVGYVASIVLIFLLATVVLNFVVRMFNLLLLYVSAPLFVSAMPLDDGAKFQSWLQAFVIQLFSGFGQVISMRLYLIILPIVASSDLVYFSDSNSMNYLARLLMIIGGAWAVVKSSSVVTGILAGNPGMSAIQNEGEAAAVPGKIFGSMHHMGSRVNKFRKEHKSKDKDKNKEGKDSGGGSDGGSDGGGGGESAPHTPSRNRDAQGGKPDFVRNKDQQAVHDQRSQRHAAQESQSYGLGAGDMDMFKTKTERRAESRAGGGDSQDNSEAFSNLFGE